MFELQYTDKALKQLEKLDKNMQDRILHTLERIRIRPTTYVKKLVGNPYFRLRVGDYRIIVSIKNDQMIIMVVEVGHRKNIYK
ncbi:MAG TPA: type II toxin-antitoxin system RelE/ParE family toxin [Candidatus Nanoarchaeia archaeon]|nr:type II toxin-antitoxin system RelE/ParE family toxin [Candidatus Nanoarchaeia archaeon]